MKWLKTYRLHFLAWALFIIWETIIMVFAGNKKPSFLIYLFHYGGVITLFYFYAHSILPKLLKFSNRILAVIYGLIVFLLCYLAMRILIDDLLKAIQTNFLQYSFKISWEYIISTMYRGFYFYGMATSYSLIKNYIKAKNEQVSLIKEQKRIEQQLLTTQNLYLKAQINPHFLFNTLHFINSQLPEESNASEAVLRLSKIMHFAFKKEDSSDKIRILEELMQIQELIALQELRGDINKLELQYDLAVCNLKLIPLVLLTLAENIYKHGDLKEEPAILSLKLENDELRVSSRNKIQIFEGQSDQTGLENLKSRLIASYGKQTKFESLREQDYFKINIAIPIIALAS